MSILITGTSGFLGRRLAAKLARRHTVYALQRESVGEETPVIRVPVDLSRRLDPGVLPARIDNVVHLAQSRRCREFPSAAAEVVAINVASTVDLLNYAVAAGARQFILASTGSVYSGGTEALDETAFVAPTDLYAATKYAAEVLLRPYGRLITVCTLRLFFLYGPGQTGRLAPDLIQRVRTGRPITLRGTRDGMILNPTYVDDAAEVFNQALSDHWSGVINVASPVPVSLREFGHTIARELGTKPVFEQLGGEEPPMLMPNLMRLAAFYDLRRFRSLEEGIRITLSSASHEAEQIS